MSIVEAECDGLAWQAPDLCRWPYQAFHITRIADRHKPSVPHGNRLRHGPAGVDGQDSGLHHNQIGGSRGISCGTYGWTTCHDEGAQ